MSFAPVIKPYSDECGLALADFLSTATDVLSDLPRSLTVTVVSHTLRPMAVKTVLFRSYSDSLSMYSEGLRVQDIILGLIEPGLVRMRAKAVLLQYGGFLSVMGLVSTEDPNGLKVTLQAPHSFTALGGGGALAGIANREKPTPVLPIDPRQKTKLYNLWKYPNPKKSGRALPDTTWVLLPAVLQALASLVNIEDKGGDGRVFIMPEHSVMASNGQSVLRSNGIHWMVCRINHTGSGDTTTFRAEVGYGSDFHNLLVNLGIKRLVVDCKISRRSVSFSALSELSTTFGRVETCFSFNLPVIALHETDNWWKTLTNTLNGAISDLSIQADRLG